MAIMLPQVGVSGSTLAPRIARVPSATMATAMLEQRDRVHRGEHVGQHLADDHASMGGALGARRGDELALRPAQGAGAGDAPEHGDRDRADREDQRELGVDAAAGRPWLRAQDRDQREGQDHRGDGEEHVEQQAHDDVDLPAEVTPEQSERTAEHEADQHRGGGDHERGAAAPRKAGQHVAAVEVAAEEVTGCRAGVGERSATRDLGDALLRVVEGQHRREDRKADHERDPTDRQPAGDPETLLAESADLGPGGDRGDLDGAGVDRASLVDRLTDELLQRVVRHRHVGSAGRAPRRGSRSRS